MKFSNSNQFILDLLTNCEKELLNNNLFTNEQLLSEFDDSLPMEGDYDFFQPSPSNVDIKDSTFQILQEPKPNVSLLQPASTSIPQQIAYNSVETVHLQTAQEKFNPALMMPQVTTATVQQTQLPFGSHYTISPNMNFNVNVPSPVVTLAPVTTQQRQLLLPAKIIKSEPLYSGRSPIQTINNTPVQHQIHTLVNTGNGTVLATGGWIKV